MGNYVLVHHGVKGQKWGVRRDRVKAIGSIAKSSSEIANNAANIAGKGTGRKSPSKKMKKELSEMSDQELRNRINRLNMEQQYADLNPSRTSRGAARAKTILEVAGSVAAIGASAAGIALAIMQMKKG